MGSYIVLIKLHEAAIVTYQAVKLQLSYLKIVETAIVTFQVVETTNITFKVVKKYSGVRKTRTLLLGEDERERERERAKKVCFCSEKNVLKFSLSNAELWKNSGGNTPYLCFEVRKGRGWGSLLSFSENGLMLSYGVSNAEFKIFPVVIHPDSCFRGGVGEAKLHLLVILSGYTALLGPHQLLCPRAPPT